MTQEQLAAENRQLRDVLDSAAPVIRGLGPQFAQLAGRMEAAVRRYDLTRKPLESRGDDRRLRR